MIDDGLATTTVADQRELEATVAPILRRAFAAYEARGDEALALNRAAHIKYLSSSLSTLSSGACESRRASPGRSELGLFFADAPIS